MRSEFDDAERVCLSRFSMTPYSSPCPQLIDETISYTRTQGIFSTYVARLTLHEAQLAHALNKPSRALQCYQVAAWLSRKRDNRTTHTPAHTNNTNTRHRGSPSKSKSKSTSTTNTNTNTKANAEEETVDGEEDFWLNTAARAGELWLRIGLLRQTSQKDMAEEQREKELNRLRKIGESVMKDCRGLGGTLEAIAEVLDSCLTKEFLKAKFVFEPSF